MTIIQKCLVNKQESLKKIMKGRILKIKQKVLLINIIVSNLNWGIMRLAKTLNRLLLKKMMKRFMMIIE